MTMNMDQICAQFDITRQAHYQQVLREQQRQHADEIILEMVRQVRRKHPRQGTRKLLFKLQPMLAVEGLQIGRDRLFELLRKHDLLVHPKKAYRRTTIPGYWRTPNLLPGMTISRPNQVWVCDITYLEIEIGNFAYLFLLMDLFSRFIVGWHLATSLVADGAVACLRMALKTFPKMKKKRHSSLRSWGPVHRSFLHADLASRRYSAKHGCRWQLLRQHFCRTCDWYPQT